MITSNQNAKIKLARALLGRPKERRQAGAFIVEGVRLVEEAVHAEWPIRFLLYTADLNQRGKEIVNKQNAKGADVEEVSTELMQSLSGTETPQGILAAVGLTELPIPKSLDFVLILDQIRDPGNLGALLRTADAAGVQAVLLPPETTDAFAPKVVRAGMGAHFRLPIRALEWQSIEQVCRSENLQAYLADMNGRSCWDADLRVPLALIVGGEATGAGEHAVRLADQHIGVPMAGKTESLNAAVAGSVLLFEIVRQRWIRPYR